jgi:hypothetical protein
VGGIVPPVDHEIDRAVPGLALDLERHADGMARREVGAPEFKRAVPSLAWGSFAWRLSEPDNLVALDGAFPGGIRLLSDFGRMAEWGRDRN